MTNVERAPGAVTAAPGRLRGELPDFSGVAVDELADRTGHPVLRALLPEVSGRLRRPAGSTVAYYDDAPGVASASAAE